MTFYYILAGIILILVIIKIRGKNKTSTCGPFCRLSKSTPPKKPKTYSESLKKIREKIEGAKREKEENKKKKSDIDTEKGTGPIKPSF